MRIHLPLHPHHFVAQPIAGPSSSPLVQLGGELVILELQGELSYEGEKAAGVVGVLGLDRPDKPTLHLGEHHLLHGKIASLVRPYAVIRRVVGVPGQELGGEAVEGDAEEEESGEEDEDEREDNTPAKNRARNKDDEDEEDESPLFAPTPALLPIRPNHRRSPNSSSPIYPPSAVRDYSSELDMASPARERDNDDVGFKRSWDDEDDDEDDEGERKKLKVEGLVRRKKVKKEGERERTRHYEVIGVVRKKVVFALRPEPIVTATVLPV